MTAKGFTQNLRLQLVAGLIVACFAVVSHRLVELHVLERGHFLAQIHDTRHRVVADAARRGDIFDARGDLLATSKTEITLSIDPWAVPEKREALKFAERKARFDAEQREARGKLAQILGLSSVEIEALFAPTWKDIPVADDTRDGVVDGRTRDRFVKIREGLAEEQFLQLTAFSVEGRKDPVRVVGLTHERKYRRVYPHNELAAHVVGFVNKAEVPSGGVEAFADQYLRGLNGWREIERDGKSRELAQFRNREVPPSDGWGVHLSLDTAVQHIVESELRALVNKHKPTKATIIVSDAQTGFLLALANFPTFDLNKFSTVPMEDQRNYAAADLIEPGSTFKVVALAGALNEGLITPTTQFDCTLESQFFNGKMRRFMRDDHRYAQPLTVAEVIAKSSNVGTAQIGMLLGERRLYNYARAFGYGERSGYPLGREEPGLLADPAKWSGIDITRIPAGYSIAATPLQIHYGMDVIASGGQLLRPQILRSVTDAQGEVVYRFRPAARRTVLAPSTASAMAQMLQKVASVDGTAKIAAIPGYEVAGKTGTAQKLINGRYSERNHVGSFVGFFPASAPRVVITVVVDDGHPPSGGTAYGSVVAAPSFKVIAEQLIQYLDIKPAAARPPARLLALANEGASR
jgi:cell division protein FtsI (penicillin-binding protein 3)